MPAPLLPLLALAALGAAAVAASSKKTPSSGSGNYTLDNGLSPAQVQQVLGAIANDKDPSALNLYATQMDAQGFPLAANALRMRAAMLTPGAPLPDVQGLDGNMDPATKTAVLQALATETDPNKLMTFAGTIQLQYPIAAGLLVAKAQALGGGTPMQAPQAGIPVANPSADVPAPAPVVITPPSLALPAPGPYVAPMAPPAPSAVLPTLTPALVAEATSALGSGDPSRIQTAWNDLNQALSSAGGIAAVAPSLSAQMQAMIAQLTAAPPAAPPMPDNVLPPRPAPVPMPPPNPGPLGPPAPPPDGTTWILATNADVARDGVQSRYSAILAGSPVGTEVHETHNGNLWKFRVISNTTDPGLTTYAKDVKGWWAAPSSVVVPAAVAPAPMVQVPVSPLASVSPLVPAMPAAPSSPFPISMGGLTGVQQAAAKMANALAAHDYKQADQPFYKAFQIAAGMSPVDGFPGTGEMTKLQQILSAAGLPMPPVKIYAWHSTAPSGATGAGAYDGSNAPLWSSWTAPVATTSGHGRRSNGYGRASIRG